MGKNFRETLNEQMKDPEFRAEWEAQEPERQIMHAILEGRQNCNLTQEQLAQVTGINQANISHAGSWKAIWTYRCRWRPLHGP